VLESDDLPWNKGRKARRSRPGQAQARAADAAASASVSGSGDALGDGAPEAPTKDGCGALQDQGELAPAACKGLAAKVLGSSHCWVAPAWRAHTGSVCACCMRVSASALSSPAGVALAGASGPICSSLLPHARVKQMGPLCGCMAHTYACEGDVCRR